MSLDYKQVKFDIPIASYRDCTSFKPDLPPDYYYLGPVATSDSVADQNGLIVKALDASALADVVGWKKVGPNNEPEPPPPFSTWRGTAPEGYIVVGDFFVTGNSEPTPEQTKGIKAIRKDLVHELRVQRMIWEGRQPWSVVTLWDVVAVPLLFITTGAFASVPDRSADDTNLAVLRFNVNQV
ncbi:hypothetical protein SERLA73DRAFT_179046 [Serpula lacrymans var. lacrymans S7.3]|uniref:Uncharacterized protein n=2 Tax=Serpula lacrymans var. lacrymans TaxID=341189 RepID=F8PTM1_SERL3|nr:uncharacterized protein SERLADRAFT_463983 [Serpula lacrymans var. lacrymans S7.9]EGO01016.1 hypothetical protein SERLA73DRAFT_179046 [Serpula lacrymans var. lacrymans S7.3]EGO26685.1 hypothetical protein SERLADRAFT_463983 [Serpula lacrymans var. lacrymans S7.9]